MGASLVYLSGPLPSEGADEDSAIMWRALAANWLGKSGVAAYNPLLALSGPPAHYGPSMRVNEAVKRIADALLVNLADFSGPTSTVLADVYDMLKRDRPVVVVHHVRDAVGALKRCISVASLEQAVAFLTDRPWQPTLPLMEKIVYDAFAIA